MNSTRFDLVKRREMVGRAVEEFLRRRHAGEPIDEASVIAQNPTLMPELALELARVKRATTNEIATAVDVPLPPASNSASGSGSYDATIAPTPMVDAPVSIAGYTLVREVHRGGQGLVFEGVQNEGRRRVAVKVLRQGPMASAQEQARFDREAQILAALKHPNIVCVVDRGRTAEGAFYLVMEWVDGLALDEWLERYFREHPEGPPPTDPSELLRLFMKICEAVNAAHLRGVVHRDIKPSNIKIDDRGEPHILDFGLAHVFSPTVDRAQPVTITGQFLGSLPWASPEQAEGIPSKIDFRTDVYSLGVVLYQMLTSEFPYEVVGNMRDVLDNIMRAEPSPPSVVIEAKRAQRAQAQRRRKPPKRPINSAIDAIVLKTLNKRREDRYQTAGELARDIGNYLAGRATVAVGMQPVPMPLWRKAALATVGLTVVAVVSGYAVLQADRWWQSRTPALASAPSTNEPVADNAASPSVQPATAPVTPAPTVETVTPPPKVATVESPPLPTTPALPAENPGPIVAAPSEPAPPKSAVDPPALPAEVGKLGPIDPSRMVANLDRKGMPPGVDGLPIANDPTGGAGEKDVRLTPEPASPEPLGPMLKSWRIALKNNPAAASAADKLQLQSVAWTGDGKFLVASGRRGTAPAIGFYETGMTYVKWFRETAPQTGLRYSSRRKALSGLTRTHEVAVWSNKPTAVLSLPCSYTSRASATASAWSPDGTRMVVGSSDGLLTFYDVPSGKTRQRLQFHASTDSIRQLDWSSDGRFLAVAVAGSKVIDLLDSNGSESGEIKSSADDVQCVAFSPAGSLLAVGGKGSRFVELWDVETKKLVHRLDAQTWPYAIVWSPDGGQLALACASGNDDTRPGVLCLYNLGAETRLWEVAGAVAPPEQGAFPACWSPEGRQIAAVSGDHKIVVYDAPAGRPRMIVVSVQEEKGPFLPLAVSPNGHYRGPKGVDAHVLYIATTTDDKETRMPSAEFFTKFAVQNNAESLSLLPGN